MTFQAYLDKRQSVSLHVKLENQLFAIDPRLMQLDLARPIWRTSPVSREELAESPSRCCDGQTPARAPTIEIEFYRRSP